MFEGWDSFYLMIGSAAAGLIGLLFVVVTLTQVRELTQALRAISIYMTPTVLGLAVVLAASAAATAPQAGLMSAANVLMLGALAGLGDTVWASVGIRSMRLNAEPPHWTDFWLYGVVPAVVHLALIGASIGLWLHAPWAVQAIAILLLALLLVSIRNAWDLVTWMAPRAKADGG